MKKVILVLFSTFSFIFGFSQTGDVGIGTSTPDSKLHINDAGGGNESLIKATVSDDSEAYFEIGNITSTGGVWSPGIFGAHGTSSRPTLSFWGFSSLSQDGAGALGTNPAITFTVRRDAGSFADVTTSGNLLNRDAFQFRNHNTILLKMAANGVVRIPNLADASSAVVLSNADGDLTKVSLTGSTGDVLRGDGTFGAGTVDTDDQTIDALTLSGTTLNISLEDDGVANETLDLSDLKNDFDWYQGATTTNPTAIGNHIYTQGNVGIGDFSGAAPNVDLHVKGGGEVARFENPGGSAGFMTFYDQTDRIAYIGDGSSGSNHFFLSNDAAGGSGRTVMNYGDASNRDVVVLHEGGNVGIGTDAPARLLHVKRSDSEWRLARFEGATHAAIEIDGTDGSEKALILLEGGVDQWKIGMDNTNGAGGNDDDFVVKQTNNGTPEFMIQSSTGNVGIGTANPDNSAILDISSTNKGVSFPNVQLDTKTASTPITSAKKD